MRAYEVQTASLTLYKQHKTTNLVLWKMRRLVMLLMLRG